ncbi:MAG: methylenetetrahydrofolate reductase [Rikenellaceae bacterium]|nr:methylenetetrahydrofolate reductase [Rikenellaceae bacterium]
MKITDIVKQAEREGTPRFAVELLPPLKGDGVQSIFEAIDPLMEFSPAYINVTCHREDVKYVEREDGLLEKRVVRRRPGTVGISAAIMRRYNVEVVPHIICGGLSKYDIEDALIDLDFLGINNVLALRGDCLKGERTFTPHPDGHTNASQLVGQIAAMNTGNFIDCEVAECRHSRFCIGVAGYPEKHMEAPNLDHDIRYLKEKVDAGADYIVTQMSFDNEKILSFIDRCRRAGIRVPIIPGIKPFSTKSQLTVLPQVFHVDLPQKLVDRVEKCSDNGQVRQVGIEWAVEQGRGLIEAGIPVLHFYPMGKTDNMYRIAKELFG